MTTKNLGFNQSSLPADWSTYGAGQKINYFNQNGITPDQLKSFGTSQTDLDWMKNNGYNVQNSLPNAGVNTATNTTAGANTGANTGGLTVAPNLTGTQQVNLNAPSWNDTMKTFASNMGSMNNDTAYNFYKGQKDAFGWTDDQFKSITGYDPTKLTAPAAQPKLDMNAASQATTQGYNATTANLGNAYASMGANDPTKANAQLLSGQVNNPYLDAQAQNIQTRLNRNLQENIMPGIGQGATMAGGYGGTRMGIAQGKAIADTQDNLAGQLANLYGTANENAQNRMAATAQNLSGLGAQAELANAGFQNQASQFGANAANQASMFNAGQNNQMSQFNRGQANNMAIAGMQNNTAMRGQDQSYNLGMTNANNNLALGSGQLQNQAQANSNALALGSAQIQNQAQANSNALNLGSQQLQLQNQANQNSYNLGLGNQSLAQAQLDSNNQQFGANYGLNVLNAQNNWANNNLLTANQIASLPLAQQQAIIALQNQIAGQGGSTSQTNQGNPWMTGLGGLQLVNQLYK